MPEPPKGLTGPQVRSFTVKKIVKALEHRIATNAPQIREQFSNSDLFTLRCRIALRYR